MNNTPEYRRGDIVWVPDELPNPTQPTYVLHGARPCVIVSSSDTNRFSATLIVAPVTHTIKDRIYPGQFDMILNGEVSRVRCDQLRVVDKRYLDAPYAALSHHLIDLLDNALSEIVGLKASGNIAQKVESV